MGLGVVGTWVGADAPKGVGDPGWGRDPVTGLGLMSLGVTGTALGPRDGAASLGVMGTRVRNGTPSWGWG